MHLNNRTFFRKGERRLSLVTRLKDRDETALEELIHQYGDYLVRTAYLLTKDHQLAEEAVQDTFMIAFQKANQLNEDKKVKSWLVRIMINECRMRMRKRVFKHVFPHITDFFHRITNAYEATPEEALLELARNQTLTKALQQLAYLYREVLTLYYFNEMSITEISSHLKINENTVKSRLKRGRAKLKALLEGGLPDERTAKDEEITR